MAPPTAALWAAVRYPLVIVTGLPKCSRMACSSNHEGLVDHHDVGAVAAPELAYLKARCQLPGPVCFQAILFDCHFLTSFPAGQAPVFSASSSVSFLILGLGDAAEGVKNINFFRKASGLAALDQAFTGTIQHRLTSLCGGVSGSVVGQPQFQHGDAVFLIYRQGVRVRLCGLRLGQQVRKGGVVVAGEFKALGNNL